MNVNIVCQSVRERAIGKWMLHNSRCRACCGCALATRVRNMVVQRQIVTLGRHIRPQTRHQQVCHHVQSPSVHMHLHIKKHLGAIGLCQYLLRPDTAAALCALQIIDFANLSRDNGQTALGLVYIRPAQHTIPSASNNSISQQC